MSKKLKNIGFISLLTVVSRVLALVRDQFGAAIFGASMLNSAFLNAFNLPNLFRRLLGEGALTAAFVPTLQEELRENGRIGAFQLLNKIVSRLLVISGLLVVFSMIVLSQSRILKGHEERWYVAADLAVILFPYLALVCIAAVVSATLNVFQHFIEPALSPIWLNLAMILSLGGAGLHFAKTPMGEMYWLCAGVLIGGFFQMAVPAVVLMREGWRPRLDFAPSPRVREIAMLMAPGLFGTAIYQINIFVSRNLAFSLNDSAVTIMFYANRLMEFPIGVFAIAVMTVVYPLLARHAAEKNFDSMAEDFRKGIRLIIAINIPAAAGLILLGHPIVRLIYQHGQFTAEAASKMAVLLQLFAIGLPFFSVVNLTVRAFYALKDTKTPVKIAVIDFLVNICVSLVLMRWFAERGLVLASTTAIIVQAGLLQRALVRRLPGMTLKPLWPSFVKVLIGTATMSVVVLGGWSCLAYFNPGARSNDWIAVLAIIPVGVLAYGVTLWFLRIEGREELAALFERFRGNSKAT